MSKRDYYQVLGVSKNATADEIKQAYRKLARQYHPDVNKSPDAESKFKEINEANEVLSDSSKKQMYDTYGHQGVNNQGSQGGYGNPYGGRPMTQEEMEEMFGGFGGFEDIFRGFGFGGFGGSRANPNAPRKGKDMHALVNISMDDAYTGRKITIKTPDGKTHDVTIPAGIESNMNLRIKGKGYPGVNKGPNGDVILTVMVQPHKYFERDGLDVNVEIPISFTKLITGTKFELPFLGKTFISIDVPEMLDPSKILRVKEKGFASVNNPNQKGNLYIKFKPTLPKKLSRKA